MNTFSWEYLSYLSLDQAVAYKEVIIIPILLLVLSTIWMKLVQGISFLNYVLASQQPTLFFLKGENDEKKVATDEEKKIEGIDVFEAYQDALLNEVDSGTEIDSPDEEEEKEQDEDKEDAEIKNKDDWNGVLCLPEDA